MRGSQRPTGAKRAEDRAASGEKDDSRILRAAAYCTKSVSRFSRNLLGCIGWVRYLKEHELPIPVFFEQEHLNALDNTSNIILFVLAMVAEEESHIKSGAMLLSLE